jgi:hypothetical protein
MSGSGELVLRALTPTPAPVPSGLARLRVPLVNGLPQTIVLDAELSFELLVPSGVATAWRDADPSSVVSASATGSRPLPPGPGAPVGAVRRVPLRLVLRRGGVPCATLPLVAGLRRVAPDGGESEGTQVELALLGWEIRAGSLRAAGDFGSWLEIGWARRDGAVAS